MGKAHPAKESFNGGEWSPKMRGRSSLDKYPNSCERLENMIGLRQGPAQSRPGTIFVNRTGVGQPNTADEPALLIPYVIDEENAYVLEFTDNGTNVIMDVYKNGAQLSGGTLPVTTTYVGGDLFDGNRKPRIKYAQNSEEMYLVNKDTAPQRITTTADNQWVISTQTFVNGPYFEVNASATTITPGGLSGNITLTASAAIFAATDVNRLVQFLDSANLWRTLKITAFSSTVLVNADVLGTALATTTASTGWRLGLWSDTTGFPTAVTFHESRLCFNGPADVPARVDMSVSFQFTNFRPYDSDGTVRNNDAVSAILNTDTSHDIRWIKSMEKGLILGTGGGNFIIRPTATTSGLGPLNIESKQIGRKGNANLSPVMVDDAALFIQSAQREVRELAYTFESDNYRAPDLTILAEHITKGKLVGLAYQDSPHSIVWGITKNGRLLSMTYDRDQDVIGWQQHLVGGNNTHVFSMAVIPGQEENNDELWLCTRRIVDGNTVHSIEKMEPFWEDGDLIEDAVYVDSAITYSGASTATITGLSHLEGEVVSILGDGATQATKTVSSGSITLDNEVVKASVGLGYTQAMRTHKFDAGSSDGTAQGKIGRISKVVVRLWQSLGGKIGSNVDDLEDIPYREVDTLMEEGPGIFTGDVEMHSFNDHSRDGTVTFENSDPTPVTLLALYPTQAKDG